ncbi:DUF982 domain-containing protein [Mesorhizobium captivum]|uniref:DUF982 domain-containing protein n=1 Tax=Mesorhizobium captivum TaxID=3072319 RepID=UPI002A242F98|nr:DUF982 domain-containing protein [Mesorhizobium sp. VK3C]MDX8450327.1 DUF982 domain-containing protein [Mesorhizobium sp. VK3C]
MRTQSTLWFSPPVSIKTSQPGVCYEVNNVQAAAENLLGWPYRGRNWNKAVQACLAALAGRLMIRIAFEAAATEEGMLLDCLGLARHRSPKAGYRYSFAS